MPFVTITRSRRIVQYIQDIVGQNCYNSKEHYIAYVLALKMALDADRA